MGQLNKTQILGHCFFNVKYEWSWRAHEPVHRTHEERVNKLHLEGYNLKEILLCMSLVELVFEQI